MKTILLLSKKHLFRVLLLLFTVSLLVGCRTEDKEEEVPENKTSIIPTTFMGRTNEVLGKIDVAKRSLKIGVYDHGQIDGDVVSIYVNGKEVISNYTLDGPSNTKYVNVDLEYKGYNYILLYAHNEGSIPPNTCTILIDDGSGVDDFILSSNLQTNGAVDVVVQ